MRDRASRALAVQVVALAAFVLLWRRDIGRSPASRSG
jgi:hypothetical protein